jgi:hypothetical protein
VVCCSRSLRVIDLLDPSNTKEVSSWWVPGQRRDENDTRSKWRARGELLAFENFDGSMYVPNKVEDGGRYGYVGSVIFARQALVNP